MKPWERFQQRPQVAEQSTPKPWERFQTTQPEQSPEPEKELSTLEKVAGYAEPTMTLLSGIVAEPVAGIAGLGTGIADVVTDALGYEDAIDGMQATKNINAVREAMTYVPKTEEGMEGLETVGRVLEPVADKITAAEDYLGDAAYESGGQSAIAGAAGKTIPTMVMTALGLGSVRRVLGISKAAGKVKGAFSKSTKSILEKAAPTMEGLKEAANKVYKQIDDLGVSLKPEMITPVIDDILTTVAKEGFDGDLHSGMKGLLKRLEGAKGNPATLSEIETLRRVAQNAINPTNPSQSRLAYIVMNKIDDALDNAKSADFVNPSKAKVGAMYKDARKLHGKAKRSEMINDIFENSVREANPEQYIKSRLKALLRNKKTKKMFKGEEKAAIEKAIKNGKRETIYKVLGGFGISGNVGKLITAGTISTSTLTGGTSLLGVIPVALGTLSAGLAKKLARGKSRGADLMVRAGKDAEKVVEAYYKAVPKKLRSTKELTELLMRPGISLEKLNARLKSMPPKQRDFVKSAIVATQTARQNKEQQ
jgi:hypothetical protein